MKVLQRLFENNRFWQASITRSDPEFFEKLASQQNPEYLWIGCSDSRVPANQIVGLLPGEIFVHRNVANMVFHADINCLSVLQFAIDALKVKHVIVCGHYGCGGVRAALENQHLGLVDNWLRPIRALYEDHRAYVDASEDVDARVNRLCELNVVAQVRRVCRSTVVDDAWRRGQPLSIHGWIYGLRDGLLRDLDVTVESVAEAESTFARGRTLPEILSSPVESLRG